MQLTITGNTPSLKNNKEIAYNHRTQRQFVVSNPRVKKWMKEAIQQLQAQFMGYQITGYPINVAVCVWFDNDRRHDLDNVLGGVMDALAKAGVIEDDNVKFVDSLSISYGGIDKTNPRVEIYLDD